MSGKLFIFFVEDGAEHWVRARHIGEALSLVAQSGWETREAYIEDQDPEVRRMGDFEMLELRIDVDLRAPAREACREWSPPNSDVLTTAVVRAPALEWAACGDAEIVGSSEW